MGFFWHLIQQSQISSQRDQAATLEKRVEQLERDLDETNRLLRVLLERLETHFHEDLNQDGQIG
jgi:phage shock protein A